MTATLFSRAFAHANIALIKYWGKYNLKYNVPQVSSLSLTLDNYGTTTTLSQSPEEHDVFILNGHRQIGPPAIKVQRFLDIVRSISQNYSKCLIVSENNFPTKSGLASSASGFAALAVAANDFFKLNLSLTELSRLARRGSASAARSIFDGFSLLHGGNLNDMQSFAEPIPSSLKVRLIIAQCSTEQKEISSTDGMNSSAQTSPFYPIFVDQQSQDIDDALLAIAAGDIRLLGETMEYSTLKMHSCCLSSRPGFWYWNDATLRVMTEVKRLRAQGATAYFTMDAGPHVKILCPALECDEIINQLKNVEGIVHIDHAGPGTAARILKTDTL